ADLALTDRIHAIHARSRGTYGTPRVHAELAATGVRVGRKRVARLMRAARLEGVSRRKRIFTTIRNHDARPAPDLVARDFRAAGGDAYDNALCESFFATLECELLDRRRFATAGRGPDGRLRVPRGVVQPAPSPLRPRLPVAGQLRTQSGVDSVTAKALTRPRN